MRMLNIPYNNYKTQTCKNFEKEGRCKFGEKCSYAHGAQELRSPYENILIPPQLVPQLNQFKLPTKSPQIMN
jgi:hypothetical protein